MQVCLELINSPLNCSNCKGIVGKQCLDNCLAKRKSCPLCGIDNFKPTNPNNKDKNNKNNKDLIKNFNKVKVMNFNYTVNSANVGKL